MPTQIELEKMELVDLLKIQHFIRKDFKPYVTLAGFDVTRFCPTIDVDNLLANIENRIAELRPKKLDNGVDNDIIKKRRHHI